MPRTLKMRRGVYSLRGIARYIASTPPFSSVWQIAREMVSAFKTPHTSLPRHPFGGVRLKQRRPHRTRAVIGHVVALDAERVLLIACSRVSAAMESPARFVAVLLLRHLGIVADEFSENRD